MIVVTKRLRSAIVYHSRAADIR